LRARRPRGGDRALPRARTRLPPPPRRRERATASAGARSGHGAGGSAAVTESSPSVLRADQPGPLEIRRLVYTDLPQVIGIERRVFPTSWSLALFVLALSQPTGVCIEVYYGWCVMVK